MALSQRGEAVTPQELLLARLDAFATKFDEAKNAIESIDPINPKLYERAAPGLLKRIENERKKIAQLHRRTDKNQVDAAAWGTLHSYEEESATLFGECLAFLQASRARGHDVDADLCEIADALLDELAKLAEIAWNRFTVLSTEELFRDLAQIIRLRFPFSGIWDLPVAAHEFGHFVAGRLNVSRPDGSRYLAFQEEKRGFKQQHPDLGDEWMLYVEEYFADAFATFALGPAYACTALLLRFDPATGDGKTHPSSANRAYAILQTLRRMNSETECKGDFTRVADELVASWNQVLTSAGQPTVIEGETLIGGLVSNLYEILESGVPRVRFSRWKAAVGKRGWLREAPPPNVGAADFKLSDLLNAAWLCWSEPNADIDHVSDNVIALAALHT